MQQALLEGTSECQLYSIWPEIIHFLCVYLCELEALLPTRYILYFACQLSQ